MCYIMYCMFLMGADSVGSHKCKKLDKQSSRSTIVKMQSCLDINKESTSIQKRRNTLYVYRSAVRRLYKSF